MNHTAGWALTVKPGKVTANGHPSDEVGQGRSAALMKQAGLK